MNFEVLCLENDILLEDNDLLPDGNIDFEDLDFSLLVDSKNCDFISQIY